MAGFAPGSEDVVDGGPDTFAGLVARQTRHEQRVIVGIPRRADPGGKRGLERDQVLPAIAVVIGISQRVARLGQHLVESHLGFAHALAAAFFLVERAQEALALGMIELRPGGEPVQVRIGLPERDLEDVVYLSEIRRPRVRWIRASTLIWVWFR